MGFELELQPIQSGAVQIISTCGNYFKKATEINPNDWEAWHSLGVWYFHTSANLGSSMKRVLSYFAPNLNTSFEEGVEFFKEAIKGMLIHLE